MIAVIAATLGVAVGLSLVVFDLLPSGLLPERVNDSGNPAPASTSCSDEERTDLRITAAPEITPALQDLARNRSEELGCIQIDVTAAAPSRTRAALSRGWVESSDGPAPHVWIPTTSTEVELVRAAADDLIPDDTTSLARSPTVIAMPQPMADALGWPDAPITWSAVAKLAAADNAWEDRDQPDWGDFKLSFVEGVQAEPSIGAVAALTRAVGALPSGTEPPSDDEAAQQFQARAQLLLLERKVEYLGDTTEAQLEELRASDETGELLTTASALPLTEQLAWQYNRGEIGGEDPPETPLSIWYPEDGAADADYPYAVLNASWSDQRTTDAAQDFLGFLGSDMGQRRLRQAGFRDSTRQATPELAEEEEFIRPDMAPPAPERMNVAAVGPVVQAWRGLSQTGNLLSVVDVSGSMAAEVPGTGATRLQLSAQGLAAGVSLLDPETIAGIWEFSTDLDGEGVDHRELIPLGKFSDPLGDVTRQEATIGALRELEPQADTGLYDTIIASYEYMLENYQPGRVNAVIFFTDGANDDDDGLSLGQLQDRLRELVDPERPVLILGVAYGAEADFETLNAVTTITDGKLYILERPEDIRNVFIDVQTGGVG